MILKVRCRRRKTLLLTLGADLLLLGGVAAVGVSAWALLSGTFYQQVQRARFAEQLKSEPLGSPEGQLSPNPRVSPDEPFVARLAGSPARVFRPDPRVIGEMEIPSIGLDVMVRDGVDAATLRKAAGHVPSTALPGEAGEFVVLGHRDTFFRSLRNVQSGDLVRMRTRQGRFTYHIDSVEVVEPDHIRIRGERGEESITLITCFPFDYVGPAPRRWVARGRLMAADAPSRLGP